MAVSAVAVAVFLSIHRMYQIYCGFPVLHVLNLVHHLFRLCKALFFLHILCSINRTKEIVLSCLIQVNEFPQMHLQPFTKYLRLTLVSI